MGFLPDFCMLPAEDLGVKKAVLFCRRRLWVCLAADLDALAACDGNVLGLEGLVERVQVQRWWHFTDNYSAFQTQTDHPNTAIQTSPSAPMDQISHGMDMDMDSDMLLAHGQMLPFLHVHAADTLWFQGWVLQSTAATAGACIGLFLLAIFSRWLDAMRSVAETAWHVPRLPLSFTSAQIPRGCLQGAQSLLSLAFMLAVM